MMGSDAVSSSLHPDVLRNMLKEEAKPSWSALVWLVVTLGLFVVSMGTSVTALDVGILVGVILFHEMGHFIGMRAFGYRDVRMFFIPFFGAAVQGKPDGASPSKRAIVLLLGPVPGIVAAAILALVLRPTPEEPLGKLVSMLAVVNGLNLVPFEPFDGGRLAHLLVASRFRMLDVASLVASAVGMGLLAWTARSPVLGIVALLTLRGVPGRWRVLRMAKALRESGLPIPPRIEDTPDATLERMIAIVDQDVFARVPAGTPNRDKAMVGWVRVLHEKALSEAPGIGATLVLGALYLAGFVFAVIAVGLLYSHRPGQEKPLTLTATSKSGHVRVHHPAGFKVVEQDNPSFIKLVRTVSGKAEALTVATLPHMTGHSPTEAADAMWAEMVAADSGYQIVARGAKCRLDQGTVIEYENPRYEGTRFSTCVFRDGEQIAFYEIILPADLRDAELPVLAKIGEAAELVP